MVRECFALPTASIPRFFLPRGGGPRDLLVRKQSAIKFIIAISFDSGYLELAAVLLLSVVSMAARHTEAWAARASDFLLTDLASEIA